MKVLIYTMPMAVLLALRIASGAEFQITDGPVEQTTPVAEQIADVGDCCECECFGCGPQIPFMIGDALALPTTAITNQGSQFFYRPVVRPATNNSAIPRDRFSMEYRLFNDTFTFDDPLAPSVGGDQTDDMDMFTLRLERTFCCGLMSAEIIAPMLVGPAALNRTVDGRPNEGAEFGDLTFGLKRIVRQCDGRTLSVGVQVEAPTAERFRNPNGGLFAYDVSHDAWHITPYIAMAKSRDCWFTQGFVSYRMATEDETVTDPATNLVAHTLRSPDALMIDLSLGRWLRRSCCPCDRVQGLAGVLELNYYHTDELHQQVSAGNVGLVDSGFGTVDYLTLTTGVVTELRDGSTLTVGVAFPLRQNSEFIAPVVNEGPTDRFYDWQLVLQYNRIRW